MIWGARHAVHLFAVALQLLTRIPVRVRSFREGDLRAARALFPLVGLVVAGAGIAVRGAVEPAVGRVPATVVAVAAMVLVTGAFHEDALADTADGLWGGSTAERRVEIMRDSRVGAYGAIALVITLLLRFALLAPLDLASFARAAVAGAVVGRASAVALSAVGSPSPAGKGSGMGAAVVGPARASTWALVTVFALAASVATVGPWFPVPLALALLVVAGIAALGKAKLEGLTGDVLGATTSVVDLTVLAAVVAVHRQGLL